METSIINQQQKKKIRQKLRNEMPKPEIKIWYFLKNKQMNGLKFRRQVSIGKYIVDFCCLEKNLIIEIDGDSHYTEEGIEHDKVRTDFLKSKNFHILRFTNVEIMKRVDECVWKIKEYLKIDF